MRSLLFCVAAVGLFAQDQTELARALSSSRQRIDAIDDDIIKLLNERATLVREVGLIKKRFHAPASAPGREEQVLLRTASKARPPLSPEAIRKIYQAILVEMTLMESKEMQR